MVCIWCPKSGLNWLLHCVSVPHVTQPGKLIQRQVQNSTRQPAQSIISSLSFSYFRFLASGDSYQTLGGCFRMSPCTVSLIVPKVYEVIWDTLMDQEMPPPQQGDWERIEAGFKHRWNFPNCCGAVDGKHVALRKPGGTGSLYFNYKNYFSVVLMALVDHQYRFIFVDVGNYGSNSDSGIFRNSSFGGSF